jgi:hypothetical protein
MATGDPFLRPRTDWLDVVYALNAGDFVPLTDARDLSASVFFQSQTWARLLFREPASPYRSAAGVTVAAHAARSGTFDVVRFEYDCEEIHVVVSESASFVHVHCTSFPPGKYGAEPLAQASRLATQLLSVPRTPTFTLVADDPKYRSFSSAVTVTPTTLDEWDQRIDGDVRPAGVALLCYKRHLDLEPAIPAARWFEPDFRARLLRP